MTDNKFTELTEWEYVGGVLLWRLRPLAIVIGWGSAVAGVGIHVGDVEALVCSPIGAMLATAGYCYYSQEYVETGSKRPETFTPRFRRWCEQYAEYRKTGERVI